MGLDMYLKASKYISGYKHNKQEQQNEYQRLIDAFNVSAYVDPDSPSATVEFTVAYWRKANHIHAWFVRNVQDGEDDCGSYEVSREQLGELRSTCQKVLETAKTESGRIHTGTTLAGGTTTENYKDGPVVANAEEVATLLPTTSGFFFGGTEYDEYYLNDTKETIEQLNRVLTMPEGWYFEYRASW